MASFVLVHGGCHGPWCWEQVTPLLEAQGHEVVTPDLQGLTTLQACADAVVEALQACAEPAVLVGHSLGGMAISQAAEIAPERIATLVYVSALLPRDGQAAADLSAPEDAQAGQAMQSRLTPDGTAVIVENPLEGLYGRTPPDVAARAIARLVPQPLGVVLDRVSLAPERFGSVPRTYIECLADRAIPLTLQRRMQAASPCGRMFQLDSDHSPFCSAPQRLFEVLVEGLQ